MDKKSFGAGAATPGKKSVDPQLPQCPDGATISYTNQGPCRKQVKKKKPRKHAFRVPLRKEDGNLEAQVIEYNCEFPNRVVVRLEYLMQSTKVRLNDRQWMDEFYEKLLDEEKRALKKAMRGREKAEQTRMKKLIIEGIDKDIPPELSYLHRHPVFRVNQMLQRLSHYDDQIGIGPVAEDDEITPVEPYEYDGNKFFTHLHETGTLWVPEEQRIADEEKLKGKIYRAKLRLRQKREQQVMEQKTLRLLNHPSSYPFNDPDYDEDNPSSRAALIEEQTKSQAILTRIEEKIKHSKEEEIKREAMLDLKRREQEKFFTQRTDDTDLITAKYDTHRRMSTVDDLLKISTNMLNKSKSRRKKKNSSSEYEESSYTYTTEEETEEETEEWTETTEPSTITLQQTKSLIPQLTRAYNIPEDHPYAENYGPYDNELISGLVEGAKDANDLIDLGGDVALMYDRQKMVVDKHLREMQKKSK